MPLKAVLDTVDGVDAALKGLYDKGQDGKYYLQVEGMVPNERLVEFRNNNIELKRKLETFDGIDPVKYRELSAREQQIKDAKLIDSGKVDELVAQRTAAMKAEYEGKITALDTTLKSTSSRLGSVLIDSAVKSAAVAIGVLPTAVDDVVLRAKSMFQVKDGQAVAVNDKGEVVYGRDPTKPLGVDEWVGGLKTAAPHLFEGMKGSGAPGSGGRGNVDTSKMTGTQKIAAGLAAQNG